MADRPGWKYVPSVVSLMVVALLAANYFSPLADLDFTWQIHTGQDILRTGKLRTPDHLSFTIAGQRVPDFEWLYEVTLALVWNAFGYGGLKLLRTLCVFVPLLLVAWRLRREAVRWRGVALALLIAVMVLAQSWNLRPLYCTTIGLLLVSGWLHDHCARRRNLPWRLPLVMLLWANLHPGVIVGQALLVGAIGWEWLNSWVRLNAPLDAAACRRLTWVGGLGLAATFFSPDPIERMLYPFRPELHHAVMRGFTEMRPLYSFLTQPPYTAGLVYVVAVLTAWTLLRRFRQYRLWEIALLCGLGALGNAAFRGVQDWLLVMLVLAVPHLVRMMRDSAPVPLLRLDRSWKRLLYAPLFRFQWYWPTATFAALAVVSVTPPLSRAVPVQNNSDWPVAAVDWMDAHGVEGRVFAGPNDGAYLTWRLPGRVRCYADTRGFFFPPKILEDCQYLPQLSPDWPDRLRRVRSYGADYFLLKTSGPHGVLWRAIEPHISAPLYRDDAVVLLRTDQVADGLAAYEREQASLNP